MLTVGLAGCAALPEIEAGVCGNGVVEPALGEACDGDAGCGEPATANACRRVCDDDGAGCPDGWGCGLDRLCREPTGTFASRGTTSMPTTGLEALDLDGDGRADLRGQDATGVTLVFGEADASLGDLRRVPLPPLATRVAAVDVDLDGDRDLAVGITAGLALMTADGARGYDPVAQGAIDLPLDPCEDLHGASIIRGSSLEGALLIVVGGQRLFFLDNPGACDPGAPGAAACVLGPSSAPLVAAGVVRGRLGYDGSDGVSAQEQFLVPRVGDTELRVLGIRDSVLQPKLLETLPLSAPLGDDALVAIGDFDADGCADVVANTGTTVELFRGLGAGTPAGCRAVDDVAVGLGPRPEPSLGAGVLAGRDVLFSAFVDEDSGLTGLLAYAVSAGATLQPYFLGATVTTPTSLAALDANHDGATDLVATSAEGLVDLYLNDGIASLPPPSGATMHRFPIDTGGGDVVALAVGDFDGDLHDDVALTVPEATGIGAAAAEQLLVVYGTPSGHPDAAISAGRFGARSQISMQPGGGLTPDSLLVMSNPPLEDTGVCSRPLAIVIGDTSRQLLSPFALTYDPQDQRDLDAVTPRLVLDVSSDEAPGTLATIGTLPARPILDLPALLVTSSVITDDDGFMLGAQAEQPLDNEPRFDDLQLAVAQRDDGPRDVVALSSSRALELDPATGAAVFTDLAPAAQGSVALELVDLDGDGALEVLSANAGIASVGGGLVGGTAQQVWWAPLAAPGQSWGTITYATWPDAYRCFDVVSVDVATDVVAGRRVVATCFASPAQTPTLLWGTLRPAGGFDELAQLTTAIAGRGLVAADFDGDGLEDLAVYRDGVVEVLRQCAGDEVDLACAAPTPLP
ncbi:MAG: VCBS repeat-containing protein [Kofleriaceae bacterium]